jgi:predicted transposase YbfD/YdcC
MINAWSTGASLSLGQLKSEGKSNEIKTIPKLLDLLDIKGSIVSTDAMGCQR